MLATSVKIIRVLWRFSKDDPKQKVDDAAKAVKEALLPCQEDANTPGNNDAGSAASKLSFNVETSPAAHAVGEPQSIEAYPFASATFDANAMHPIDSAVASPMPDATDSDFGCNTIGFDAIT